MDSVLHGPGESDTALRAAAFGGLASLPADLAPLVLKCRANAYRVTDADVAVPAAARGDDVVFEVVVSAAIGAAHERLAAGLRALEDA